MSQREDDAAELVRGHAAIVALCRTLLAIQQQKKHFFEDEQIDAKIARLAAEKLNDELNVLSEKLLSEDRADIIANCSPMDAHRN